MRVIAVVLLFAFAVSVPGQILIEAESFQTHGGWKLDTQFIESMGSPYLLAHGLGRPVEDARTTIEVAEPGDYQVWARTFDWVARWNAPGTPGRFEVGVGDSRHEFGDRGKKWGWLVSRTKVALAAGKVDIALHDLTGFDGRCDAIILSKDPSFRPPNDPSVLPGWRRSMLGLPPEPTVHDGYDLVVIGGGYAGMGAAISAARMGCKVALIQNRGVLGGNGSSEVRVWAQGLIRRGKFPRIGEIINEFADKATKSPGRREEFGDSKKEAAIRAEANIDLFLHHHAYAVEKRGSAIESVIALDVRTSDRRAFKGHMFVDCTGHGTIGFKARAAWKMTPKGRMGMSNMWRWDSGKEPVAFPDTPWALDLEMEDFPYPRKHHGQWFWESGFDKDPLADAEGIRDWNLRAVYGSFNAMKNRGGRDKHKNARLTWIAYIGGPRESRRIEGDVLLTQEDVISKKQFKDGCVPSTWSIDLHYPKKQYAKKYPDNPFISKAIFDARVDRDFGYPVPYRCFYSKNVSNLFMAGRCISVTHEALGTVRVMKTCGMMGEVVGKAASLCALHDCTPREVYTKHLDELLALLELPGQARREGLAGPIDIPANTPPPASATGPITGIDPSSFPGIVIDDRSGDRLGHWTEGQGLKGYIAHGYRYASPNSGALIRFEFKAAKAGSHELRIAYRAHQNRGATVPIIVQTKSGKRTVRCDMRKAPPIDNSFLSLGTQRLAKGEKVIITIGTAGAGGVVCADAAQLIAR